MGLTINMQKTKYMEVKTNAKMLKNWWPGIWEGKEFKYLGTSRLEENDLTTEIKQRITMTNKTSYVSKKRTKLTESDRSD
jgi:hypothetical protein